MAIGNVSFNVEGMRCEHCVKTLKTALSVLNGVIEVFVDLAAKRVAVEYDDERMQPETLKGTIEDAGYKVR